MAGSWRWSAAALLLTGALGASVAAVQTEVSAGSGRTATPPPASTRRPAPAEASPPRPVGAKLVVLDPGHGGSNTGAKSVATGMYEKHLTMLLARAVAARLAERGIE